LFAVFTYYIFNICMYTHSL